jgi:cell wall-associated NlpC family hydrolase
MTLFKNILLFIITIQVLVLIQISSIKILNLQTKFNQLFNTLTFQTSPTFPKLSPEEYKFFSTLSSSVEKELYKYQEGLLQNQLFRVGKGHIKKAIKDEIEVTAKKLLGTPYVWGATGPNTFDCSGFTQEVFCKAGIHIPRNSRAQAKVGKYIAYENLRRGDMVFFDTNRKKPGYVTHVGIYLSGGKFIHASSGGRRVIISSLIKSDYYKEHFLLGRRIIRGHKTNQIAQVL